jgi:formate dehydrogenase iron-sulfur subunit
MAVREKELASLPSASEAPRAGWSAFVHRLVSPFRRGQAPPRRPATGFYTDTTVCIGCKACEVACKQWNQLPADGFQWSGNSYDNTGELSATSWRHVKFIEQFPPTIVPSPRPSAANGDGSPSSLPSAPFLPSPLGGEGSGVRGDPYPKPFSLDLASGPDSSRWLMMSDVCKHCVTAPCQQACPTGALVHNEFDNVYIQPDVCNGCAYCIASCPFGVITRSRFDGHAHKCTLCFDRQRDDLEPACAKACPTQSIQFGPLDELRDRARARVAELHGRGVSGAYLYGDTATETYSELNSFYLLVDRPSTYGLPESPFNPWLNMPGDYARSLLSGLVSIVVLLAAIWLVGR